ncbi:MULTISPECIES: DUF6901 family protein [Stutzerimonas]|mgnify:CR=1 FL=1|jgi:hypothetical protein|uniref:Uncharacterized protein n=2 Tax=Stutzerimonas balearica TaxID=74829 RepID=A0A8D3Y0P9_9GAMM|nr:hypothetical protein [Stutzerimonas balearica]KIL04872.1 hypothetical protein QX25_07325 [Stutzerimonas stutzeri]MBB62016.1 hypothetical protein [Pseudomonas sp.]MBZ5755816.1 hypothetical protein [Pseudomonas sp. S5(2021)]WIX04212.1 hypothetical protein QK899_07270 [Pseudomonas sp. AR5]AJE14907.1 hypothetical protein CL52_07545 [Stutzerimonas balearica DSM 6083]
MAIEYRITLDDEHDFSYRIELDRSYDREAEAQAPHWTRLEHQRCANCPLSREQFSHCPAAVDLHRVIEDFQGLPAVQKALVWVRTPEREYTKVVGLEEGLRALLGVIMATSACPVLARLKPMAQQHLPFANNREFVLRAVSLYLARQYFNLREGRHADWELRGLVRSFQQLQLVNQAFWQRIHDTCKGDSNLKAFLTFFSMASSLTVSLETQLQKIRPMVMAAGDEVEVVA